MELYSLVKQEQERIKHHYQEGDYILYAGKVAELLPRATPLSFSFLQRIYSAGGPFGNVMRNLTESVHFPNKNLLETFMGKVYVNLAVEKNVLYKHQPVKYKVVEGKVKIGYGFSFPHIFLQVASVLIKSLCDTLRIRFVDKYVGRCVREYKKISDLSLKLTEKMRPITVEDCLSAYSSCIYIGFMHNFYYLWNRKAVGRDPFSKVSAGVYARVNNYLIRDDGELFKDNKYKSIEDFEFRVPRVIELEVFEGKKVVPDELPELPEDLDAFEGAEVLLACLRDNARLKFLPFLYYLRQSFLGVAEEFGLGDDVFFYTLDELELKKQNVSSLAPSVITHRREIYEQGKNIYLPTVITQRNLHSIGLENVEKVEKPAKGLVKGISRMGIPCSPGFIRGSVQYVSEPETEVTSEILAFENASPAFTSEYKKAGGLLFRVGSPLSHGSIIARELGVPAVVLDTMVENLHGRKIELNGSSGEVFIEK